MKLAIVVVVAVFAVWVGYLAGRTMLATAAELQQQSGTAYQAAME